MTLSRGAVRDVVLSGLRSSELEVEEVGQDSWMTVLSGEWKRTLPVLLRIDDRSMHVEALVCGALDEGHADVYRFLLQRNQKPLPVHFALDDDGDIVLTGTVPLATIDTDGFDQLLGALLTTADEVFNTILRQGFASYLDAEQRWRAARGMSPNPAGGTG